MTEEKEKKHLKLNEEEIEKLVSLNEERKKKTRLKYQMILKYR